MYIQYHGWAGLLYICILCAGVNESFWYAAAAILAGISLKTILQVNMAPVNINGQARASTFEVEGYPSSMSDIPYVLEVSKMKMCPCCWNILQWNGKKNYERELFPSHQGFLQF